MFFMLFPSPFRASAGSHPSCIENRNLYLVSLIRTRRPRRGTTLWGQKCWSLLFPTRRQNAKHCALESRSCQWRAAIIGITNLILCKCLHRRWCTIWFEITLARTQGGRPAMPSELMRLKSDVLHPNEFDMHALHQIKRRWSSREFVFLQIFVPRQRHASRHMAPEHRINRNPLLPSLVEIISIENKGLLGFVLRKCHSLVPQVANTIIRNWGHGDESRCGTKHKA